jgi:methionyl-tRNA synthetase
MGLARESNGYTFGALSAGLDRKAPWFQIKEDRQAAATSVYVILRVVDNLKTLLAPILPSFSARSRWSSTRRRPATAGCARTRR